jgi:hypothetical protein
MQIDLPQSEYRVIRTLNQRVLGVRVSWWGFYCFVLVVLVGAYIAEPNGMNDTCLPGSTCGVGSEQAVK